MTTPISFALKPTLLGDLVILRPVDRTDAVGLTTLDPETLRMTGSHLGVGTLAGAEEWYATRANEHDRIDLSIIERSTGLWAGEVVLNHLDTHNLSCGFRILLARPSFYGKGLGTEATRLVLGYAFETVGVNRIELEVYDFNPRARHVYEKVGFRVEGTKRQALRWDGEWVDAHLMSILASEWQARG